jgi:hypothetical protein
LRKTFLVAGVATLALGTAGVAFAQAPDPSITASIKLSPGKAGTKAKPKSHKLTLSIKNDPASKTTASQIKIKFPSTIKVSTKGFKQCTASDEEIINSAGAVCKSSKVGSGSANAVILANGTNIKFKVQPFIGKNELLFYLTTTAVSNTYVVHGKLSGSTMTIGIGPDVQQPAPGLYAALVDINASLSKKSGKNALIASTGCKAKKHKVDVSVAYAANPTPPSKPSSSTTTNVPCS